MKRLYMILFCLFIGITGCKEKRMVEQFNKDIQMESLVDEGLIFSITSGKKDGCIPVELSVYENGTYDFYTSYQACRPNENCNAILKYTAKRTGLYDYDVLKIVQASINRDDVDSSRQITAEYEIFTGKGETYIVENGTVNKYLDEFLKQIDVNLNTCAQPDYIR